MVMPRFANATMLLSVLLVLEFILLAFVFTGCGSDDDEAALGQDDNSLSSLPCLVTKVYTPTETEDFQNLYHGRGFYVDGNHLGHDIALPEGSPVRPTACGKVSVYRPAAGYGRLVAVVEHELMYPITVTNGVGEKVTITRFLSIYGHLRTSSDRNGNEGVLSHHAGDRIDPTDTIGYVDQDATNGDGAEHVHFGIRLQSASDAAKTDPKAWFRGYDGKPSHRKWYADPVVFLTELHAELGGPMCAEDGAGQSTESSSSGSGGSSESSGAPTGVPVGQVQFLYEGPAMPGLHELHGTWDPPGPSAVGWGPEATVQCPDIVPNNGGLECLLAMPSGTTNVTFTVKLPNGSWWGDMSYDPLGGQGATVGTVTLTGPNGVIPYQMVNNGSGPYYFNGFVPFVP